MRAYQQQTVLPTPVLPPDCSSPRASNVRSRRTQFVERKAKRPLVVCRANSSSEQVQLLQPALENYQRSAEEKKLLVYFPGTDGTGNAISPQLPGLLDAGFDVRSLYISMTDRSNWEELTQQAVSLIRNLVTVHPVETKVTLVAESFGGCLALRTASAAPELFERMVLVNPATGFANSYGGVLSLVANTNLLSVFPEQLYQVAQAVLLPFLVDRDNVGSVGLDAVRQMILMSPPINRRIAELASSQGPSAKSRRSPLERLESYGPAAAGSWRLSLLSTGNLSDETLGSISVPTLLLSSAKDRLLASLQEGARLQRVMPNALRIVLPRSGHTALLEDEVKLVNIMRWANFLPPELSAAPGASGRGDSSSQKSQTRTESGTIATSATSSVASNSFSQPNVGTAYSQACHSNVTATKSAAVAEHRRAVSASGATISAGPSTAPRQHLLHSLESGRAAAIQYTNGSVTDI